MAKRSELRRTLITKARAEGLGPDDASIYMSRVADDIRKPHVKTITMNAITIPEWMRVSLMKTGKIFRHNGVTTRYYTSTTICALLRINKATFSRWRASGLVPEPYVYVQRDGPRIGYWLYHQVQPLYSWYMHMRSRGIKNIVNAYHEKEIRKLRHLYKLAEKRFMARLGEDYVDPYIKEAGRYGVVWITGVHSIDRY